MFKFNLDAMNPEARCRAGGPCRGEGIAKPAEWGTPRWPVVYCFVASGSLGAPSRWREQWIRRPIPHLPAKAGTASHRQRNRGSRPNSSSCRGRPISPCKPGRRSTAAATQAGAAAPSFRPGHPHAAWFALTEHFNLRCPHCIREDVTTVRSHAPVHPVRPGIGEARVAHHISCEPLCSAAFTPAPELAAL